MMLHRPEAPLWAAGKHAWVVLPASCFCSHPAVLNMPWVTHKEKVPLSAACSQYESQRSFKKGQHQECSNLLFRTCPD